MNVARDLRQISSLLRERPDLRALEVRCLSFREAAAIFHQLTRAQRQRIHLTWPAFSGHWKFTVAICELLTHATHLLHRLLSAGTALAAFLEEHQGDCATSGNACEMTVARLSSEFP